MWNCGDLKIINPPAYNIFLIFARTEVSMSAPSKRQLESDDAPAAKKVKDDDGAITLTLSRFKAELESAVSSKADSSALQVLQSIKSVKVTHKAVKESGLNVTLLELRKSTTATLAAAAIEVIEVLKPQVSKKPVTSKATTKQVQTKPKKKAEDSDGDSSNGECEDREDEETSEEEEKEGGIKLLGRVEGVVNPKRYRMLAGTVGKEIEKGAQSIVYWMVRGSQEDILLLFYICALSLFSRFIERSPFSASGPLILLLSCSPIDQYFPLSSSTFSFCFSAMLFGPKVP